MRPGASSRLAAALLLTLAFAATGRAARELPAADLQALTAAIRRAQPGDTIVLRDGTWTDARITFEAQGTAEQPITLRAETPGQVILTGRSTLRIGGRHLVVRGLRFQGATSEGSLVEFRAGSGSRVASDCRLTDCAIIDSNPSSKKTNTKWISLYGQRNRVDHCYLAGKTNLGTTLVVWLADQPNHHRIDHNHFGPRPPLGENGGETIRIGTSDWSMHDSHTLVEANLFERCNGEGEIISSKSGGNVYRGNTFVACEGALTLRHGNRNTVEGNFFFGRHAPNTGGVRVIGEDHRVVNNYFEALAGDGPRSALSVMQGIVDSPLAGYFQVKRALIACNTFVDCAVPLIIGQPGARTSLPPEDCVIANNVVVGRGPPAVRHVGEPVRIRYAGNVVHGAPAGAAPDGFRPLDPRLTRAADGVWRPGEDSPLRGAAVPGFDDITLDIDGQPRGSTKDVGCDQVSTEPIVHRPLRPVDVGPGWLRAERGAP